MGKRLKQLKKNNIIINKKNNDINYKQLDISEVLYLIIQQIGFPPFKYWSNLDRNTLHLFPQYPLIANICKKGKKSKLFENEHYFMLFHEQKNNQKESEQEEDEESNTSRSAMTMRAPHLSRNRCSGTCLVIN